jgi:hypothetical protein
LGPISKILKRKSKGDTETYESFQRHFNGLAPGASSNVRALFIRPDASWLLHLAGQFCEALRASFAELCFWCAAFFACPSCLSELIGSGRLISFSRRRARAVAILAVERGFA